jgi:hypothetical protein
LVVASSAADTSAVSAAGLWRDHLRSKATVYRETRLLDQLGAGLPEPDVLVAFGELPAVPAYDFVEKRNLYGLSDWLHDRIVAGWRRASGGPSWCCWTTCTGPTLANVSPAQEKIVRLVRGQD